MPNKAEFVCYFVIFQLGNGGEVSKYLQQLPNDVLYSEPLRFAIDVWGALKTQNYAKYFKLLRTRATLLQACLMHRYVGEVRMSALRKLTRSMNPPGAKPQEYPLDDLVRNFMFEDSSDAIEFLDKCGVAVTQTSAGGMVDADGDEDEPDPHAPWVVQFNGQHIDSMLERDKNDRPIMPVTHYMHEGIDRSKSIRSVRHASNTSPGFETHYRIAEISRGFATSMVPPILAPKAGAAAIGLGSRSRTNAPPGNSTNTHMHSGGGVSRLAAPTTDTGNVRVRTPTNIASSMSNQSFPPPPSATTLAAEALSAHGNTAKDKTSHPTFSTTPAAAASAVQHTVIDKSALRNKLMMSGSLGSSRGAKAASSPIAPITDDDVWGPSDSAKSGGTGAGAGVMNKKGAESLKSALKGGPFSSTSTAGAMGKGLPENPGPALIPTKANNSTQPFGVKKSIAPEKVGLLNTAASHNAGKQSFGGNPWASNTVAGEGANASSWRKSGAQSEDAGKGLVDQQQKQQQKVRAGTFSAPALPTAPNPFPAFPPLPVNTATTTATVGGPFSFGATLPSSTGPTSSYTAPTPKTSAFQKQPAGPTTEMRHAEEVVQAEAKSSEREAGSHKPVTTTADAQLSKPLNSTTSSNTSTLIPQPLAPAQAPAAEKVPVPPRPAVNASKLATFETKSRKRRCAALLKQAVNNWREVALFMRTQNTMRIKALYLLFWRQALRRELRTRKCFIQDITSIKLTSATDSLQSLRLNGTGTSTSNLLLQTNVLQQKNNKTIAAERRNKAIAEETMKNRFHLLCDALALSGGSSSNTVEESEGEREAESLSMIQRARSVKSMLEVVGSTLRVVKTCQLRELLGLPVPPSVLNNITNPSKASTLSALRREVLHPQCLQDGPQYDGPLLLKIAVLSSASVAGVECKNSDSRCTNILRGLLSNESGYGFTADSSQVDDGNIAGAGAGTVTMKKNLGKMRKRRGLLAKALASYGVQRSVRIGLHKHSLDDRNKVVLSVIDLCGRQEADLRVPDPRPDLTAQVTGVTTLCGVTAALVVVTVTDNSRCCATQAEDLYRVMQETSQCPSTVLIVLDQRSASNSSIPSEKHYQEYSANDLTIDSASACADTGSGENFHTVLQITQIMRSVGHTLGKGGDHLLDGLVGAIELKCSLSNSNSALLIRDGLQRALQLLAGATAPTPVICKHHTLSWLRNSWHSIPIAALSSEQAEAEKGMKGTTVRAASADVNAGDTAELRSYCHNTLVKQISFMNAKVRSLQCKVKVLIAAATTDAPYLSQYPAVDFMVKSCNGGENRGLYLPDGTTDLGVITGDRSSVPLQETSNVINANALPQEWVLLSKYEDLMRAVNDLSVPTWHPAQSICSFQTSLLLFLTQQSSCGDGSGKVGDEGEIINQTARTFLQSLEDVMNAAFQQNNAELVEPALCRLLEEVMLERICAVKLSLPEYFYAIVSDSDVTMHRKVYQIQPNDANSSAVPPSPVVTAPVDVPTLLLSPVIGVRHAAPASVCINYFDQSQFSQAFPTGFGRSLFAAFGSSVAQQPATTSQPGFTPYFSTSKRPHQSEDREDFYDFVSPTKKTCMESPITSYDNKNGSSSSSCCEDKNDELVNTEALFSAAFKRTRYSSLNTPSASNSEFANGSTPHNESDEVRREGLKSEIKSERAASQRLDFLLQQALRGDRFSLSGLSAMLFMKSPASTLEPMGSTAGININISSGGTSGGSTGGDGGGNSGCVSHEYSADYSKVDPIAFIEQCKREREMFDGMNFRG